MAELNLVERVKALHTTAKDRPTVQTCAPGECGCEECVETMDIFSTLDGLPDTHLLKLGEDGWAMEHPIPCRMELAVRGLTLHDCELHKQVHSILSDGRPRHLAENTYEVEWREAKLMVHGKGDSTWYPLRDQHDPTSESFRSPT